MGSLLKLVGIGIVGGVHLVGGLDVELVSIGIF